MTSQYRLSDPHLTVSVPKCGEIGIRSPGFAPAADTAIDIGEEIHRALGIPFGMASRIVGIVPYRSVEQRGILHQDFVRPVPMPDPKPVRFFLVPCKRLLLAVDLKPLPILSACAHLRKCEDPPRAVVEAHHDDRRILRCDRDPRSVAGDPSTDRG